MKETIHKFEETKNAGNNEISKSFNIKAFGGFFTDKSISNKGKHKQKLSISKHQNTARKLLSRKRVKSFSQENNVYTDIKIERYSDNHADDNLLSIDLDDY